MTTEPIKIIFHITHFLKGGIETTLINWLRILDRRYFTIKLSVAFPTPDFEHYRQRIPNDVEVEFLLQEPWLFRTRHKKILGKLSILDKIKETALLPQIRKNIMRRRFTKLASNCDVIIDYDLSLGRFFSPPQKIPLIGFYHFDMNDLATAYPKRYAKAKTRFTKYYRIATLSKAIELQGRKLFPAIAEKFICLYNSIDLKELRHNACELQNFVPPDYEYIVAVGSLVKRKGFDNLVAAYAKLTAEHNIAEHLIIVGSGNAQEDLLSLTSKLGISKRVHFAGYYANPLPWIKNAKLFVLSSNMEGLPTVLIEALALGKAIVSTDCPTGPAEMLADGKAGLLVPVGNTAALTQAIYSVLTDSDLQRTLQTKALEQAEIFSAKNGNDAFLKLVGRPRLERGTNGLKVRCSTS